MYFKAQICAAWQPRGLVMMQVIIFAPLEMASQCPAVTWLPQGEHERESLAQAAWKDQTNYDKPGGLLMLINHEGYTEPSHSEAMCWD